MISWFLISQFFIFKFRWIFACLRHISHSTLLELVILLSPCRIKVIRLNLLLRLSNRKPFINLFLIQIILDKPQIISKVLSHPGLAAVDRCRAPLSGSSRCWMMLHNISLKSRHSGCHVFQYIALIRCSAAALFIGLASGVAQFEMHGFVQLVVGLIEIV